MISPPDALTVSAGSARLVGNTIWGVLWGLETFSQLVYEVGRGNVSCQPLGCIRLPHNLWSLTENIYEAASAKRVLSVDSQKKVSFVPLDSKVFKLFKYLQLFLI